MTGDLSLEDVLFMLLSMRDRKCYISDADIHLLPTVHHHVTVYLQEKASVQ